MNTDDGHPVARWRGRALDAILVDLDGTLLDTAADTAVVLNQTLAEQGLAELHVDQVRALIGRGVPTLMAKALALLGNTHPTTDSRLLLSRFCAHYTQLYRMDASTARPYPGVANGLTSLRLLGLKIAVVTNKQRRFADLILQRLDLAKQIDIVVGGDDCEHRKPHAQPLQHACELLRVSPDRALMVGDSTIDVLAARAAGIPVVCVPYGYNQGLGPETLACDALIESLADLPIMLVDHPTWVARECAPTLNARG